jgi:hypothetical protein
VFLKCDVVIFKGKFLKCDVVIFKGKFLKCDVVIFKGKYHTIIFLYTELVKIMLTLMVDG